MRLHTLGGLALEGSSFGRQKPLLLLAYLALEGPKARRFLAELFWPEASNPMNSLATALSQLRRDADGAVENDDQHAWTTVPCDATDLLETAPVAPERVDELYRGPFADGVDVPLGVEIEEWVYGERERLAGQVRLALLARAERDAARGGFAAAATLAERAWRLEPGELEPEALSQLHTLLRAGDHPAAAEVAREAEGFGVALQLTTAEARRRLGQDFVGRERERERLLALPAGSWAALHGPGGMGKTALLRTLPGSYLPARSGLPYATLEPLLGTALGEGEEAMLQRLRREPGRWLIDGWDDADPESVALLGRLRGLRPDARVVVAGRVPPPFETDLALELGPLDETALADRPEVYRATGGVPALVGARLRGEPLEDALDARLRRLGETDRAVYLTAALLTTPDPAQVRRALGLDGATMARALETLIRAGLLAPSGEARAVDTARGWLEAHPAHLAPLALALARTLPPVEAWPLLQRARALWDEVDLPLVREACLAWAGELLRRGFPKRAAAALDDAPDGPEVIRLRSRTLERAGHYREALEQLDAAGTETDADPATLALRATLLWRLGRPDEARRCAEAALDGEPAARAEALNALGQLARSQGDFDEAGRHYRRAATLWRALGERGRRAAALNNVGIAVGEAGNASEEAEAAFREALEAAGDDRILRARGVLNLALECERQGRLDEAAAGYHEAIALAEAAGIDTTAVRAWNNLGMLHSRQGATAEAKAALERALELAQEGGERLTVGSILANLAELTGNRDAWDEALALLEAAGHAAAVHSLRENLPANHSFRRRSRSTS